MEPFIPWDRQDQDISALTSASTTETAWDKFRLGCSLPLGMAHAWLTRRSSWIGGVEVRSEEQEE